MISQNTSVAKDISINDSQNISHSYTQDEIEPIPGDNWVDKIKFAFDEVDPERKGVLSLDQWMNSRLGQIVSREKLSDEKLKEYFFQIDSNCDLMISWDELIDYLTCQQKNINADSFDKNLILVHEAPDLVTAHKFRKTTNCLRSVFINYIEQIITLTESTLTFWSLDCQPNHQFTDPEGFIDFCYLSCLARLAIATKTRKIIFFDMKAKNKMPFSIKAVVDNDEIPRLSLADSKEALVSFKKRPRPPLFHIPTSICCNPEKPMIYVGNQAGRIEIFSLFPSKKIKYSWDSERVKVKILHNGPVTQISYLPTLSSFVSSGDDGSIYIWQFDERTKLFSIGYSFNEPTKVPISHFVFDERTSAIIYQMPSHYIGSWKIYSNQRVVKETPSQMTNVIASVLISQESSFIVTVSTSNLVSIYTPPNLELISNYYMNYHHNLVPPSGAIYVHNRLFLIGNYISCWICQTADSDGLTPHRNPLISALANDTFARIITCDETADIFTWNLINGVKALSFSLAEKEAIVSTMKSDPLNRRLVIGYSNGTIKVLAVNSGSLLSDTGKEPIDGGCNTVIFATISSSKYIVAANGRKCLVLFEDVPSKRLKFIKKYHGHTEQISKIYCIKEKYLLSIGMGNETFLWNNKSNSPIFRFSIPDDPTVACDMSYTNKLFLIGDIHGYIHIMSLDNKDPISTINVFEMNVKSPISALASSNQYPLIISGNREGYVRILTFSSETGEINKEEIFCAHLDAIEGISFSEKYRMFITAGRDNEVRLWYADPFKYVGVLGKHKKWKLGDASTFAQPPFEMDMELFKVIDKSPEENPEERVFYGVSNPTTSRTEVFEEEEEFDNVYNPVTQPQFTYERATSILSEIESICISGRQRTQMVDKLMRGPPVSQMMNKNQELMQFGDLVTDVDLENTSRLLRQLRSIGMRRKKKKIQID